MNSGPELRPEAQKLESDTYDKVGGNNNVQKLLLEMVAYSTRFGIK